MKVFYREQYHHWASDDVETCQNRAKPEMLCLHTHPIVTSTSSCSSRGGLHDLLSRQTPW